jgi:hypothetical protein
MISQLWPKIEVEAEDERELLEVDSDYFDHSKSAWTLRRLQELRGVPKLRLSLDPAPMPRVGWLLMMRLPLSVRFPTSEANLLIDRLVAQRNARVGIWRPCDEEILAYACALPGAQTMGATEMMLKSAGLWRAKNLLRAEDMMTTQDRINIKPRR